MKTHWNVKKALSMLLSFCLLAGMVSLPVITQAATSVQVPPASVILSSVTGTEGNDVVISLNLSANSGLGAATFLIKYDNTKLTYKSYAAGSAAGGGFTSFNPVYTNIAQGGTDPLSGITTMNDSFMHSTGVNAAGSLIDITFTVISGWTGTSPITLTVKDFADVTMSPIAYSKTDGGVTVEAPIVAGSISFNTNGGSSVTVISGNAGDPLTPPANPTKAGYTFLGWDPALPATLPEGNITVMALWQANSVTLTVGSATGSTGDNVVIPVSISGDSWLGAADLLLSYDDTKLEYQGGALGTAAAGSLSSFHNGSSAVAIGIANGDGITAAGALANITFKILPGLTGSTPVTLTATDFYDIAYDSIAYNTENGSVTNESTQVTWQITFDAAGGIGGEIQTVADGVLPTAPVVTKAGYTFLGWQPTLVPATADATYTAQWEQNPPATWQINFDAAGGIGGETQTVADGVVPTPPTVTKAGFTFNGWSPAIAAATADTTYTALWIPVAGPVALTVGDESGLENTNVVIPVSVSADSGLGAADLFLEYDNTKLEVQSYAAGAAAGTGILSCNLAYAPTTLAIGYANDSGLTAAGSLINITFKILPGWTGTTPLTLSVGTSFIDVDLNTLAYTIDSGSVSNLTPATSTITFNTDGGNTIDPLTGNVGDTVPAVSAPTKAGYTFLGWSPAIPASFPGNDMTVTALWQEIVIETSTITFNTLGGSTIAPLTGTVGDPMPTVPDPTKVHYVFAGWEPALPATIPSYNLQVTAKWTPVNYSITFDANGGTGGEVQSVPYNSTPTPPVVTKTDYTFNGWSPAVSVVTGDATYTAQWYLTDSVVLDVTDVTGAAGSDVVVSINISANSGMAAATFLLTYDTTKLTYKSYADGPLASGGFSSVNPNFATSGNYKTINDSFIANNAVTGSGSIINVTFTITGMAPGETTPVTLSADDFYDVDYQVISPVTILPGSVTVPAAPAETSTITFDTDGGSAIAPITGDEGSDVTAPASPAKAGYTFAGWVPAIPATFPVDDFTVVAQWTPNTYNAIFNADGYLYATVPTQMDAAIVIPATDPVKEGYTFINWSPTPGTMGAGDETFEAVFEVNEYTITFDSNGGSTVASITQDYGSTVTAPADPARAGYTFMGWQPTVPVTMPAEDTTCVAQWSINEYTITFNTDGGSAVAPIVQDYGTDVTAPADPTKAGYTFAGWIPGVPATMPAEDTTCVAQWTMNQSTITFDTDGGSAVAPITQDEGTDVTAPADPTKAGYTFAGWIPGVPATMPVDDITCVAQWTANQSTITFDTDGGSAVAPITQDEGTDVTAPADPTKTGFTFAGWLPLVPATMPVDDVTCVAQWEAIVVPTSTITFDTDGGSAVAPITQDEGTDVTAPADPTKAGYTFAGWLPTVPATMPAEDTTCVAQWTVNSYLITFDAAGGIGGTSSMMEFGAPLTAPVVTREGYTFNSWAPTVPATVPAGPATYYAMWDINSYTITFDSDGGSAVASITQQFDTTVTAPGDPTKAGFTFAGWLPVVPATMPAVNTTCVAQWTPIPTFTITFEENGGSTVADITAPAMTLVAQPADPTKAGFTFDGWYIEDGYENISASSQALMPVIWPYMLYANVIMYAQWTANQSTITFDTAGGSAVAPITLDEGAAVTAPADPTQPGYTFNGWLPTVPATMPVDDVTCVAQWTKNQSTITFDTDGGSAVAPITQDEGTDVTAPAAPTKAGYTFAGWVPGVPATMPVDNMTCVAQWTKNQSTITFDTDGGSAVAPITQDEGTAVTAPAAPTKAGYTFNGWLPTVPATMPVDDVTCVAQWIANYTITFDENGGTTVADITAPFMTIVPQPTNPTKAGFIFAGWYIEDNYSNQASSQALMPVIWPYTLYSNVTMIAQWTPISTETFTIIFNASGGNGGCIQTGVPAGATLVPPTVERAGWTFVGWSPELVTVTGDATYVAVWVTTTTTAPAETTAQVTTAPATTAPATTAPATTAPATTAPAETTTEPVTEETSVTDVTEPETESTTKSDVPQTGSEFSALALFATLSLAAAAVFVARKKKED